MKYRNFGSTGLTISEVVFGAGAVGGMLIRSEQETMRAGVRRALDGGINWIDTAPSYGDGQSEQNLGWLLSEIDDDPHVSTKLTIDLDDGGDIPGQVERSLHQSLERLRRDGVDLLQLHNRVTLERGADAGSLSVRDVLGDDGVVAGLGRVREQGLTRFIGFTALGDVAALEELVDSGRFDSAQVYHNLLNASAGREVPPGFSAYDYRGLIDRCAGKGMAVMNIRVLAAGMIAATEDPPGRPTGGLSPGSDAASDAARGRVVREVVGPDHGTMAQVAIRYALGNRSVSGALVGFSTLEHIDEAVAAVEMGSLPPEVIDRIHRLQDADFATG
jgi:L-galactose dehydrogenase/L-glyceraldehyde 3-phosphate reductase